MSILKTIEKEKVKFLMDFDYNNVLGRLKFVLGKDASFFADIRVRQNDVTWSTKDDKEYGSFIEANESEKQIIKEKVDEQIEKLSAVISGDSLIGPHTEKIISFPSNHYIFYTIKNGVYDVILTGWGCDTTEPKDEDGDVEENHVNVSPESVEPDNEKADTDNGIEVDENSDTPMETEKETPNNNIDETPIEANTEEEGELETDEFGEPIYTSEWLKDNTNIHGWLSFFFFAIAVGGLISAIYPIATFNAADYAGNIWLGAIDILLGIGMLAIACYTIYAFTQRKPNAVFYGRLYVVLVFVTNIISLIGNPDAGLGGVKQTFRGIIWGIIWFLYLLYSEQVQEVIPKSFRKVSKFDWGVLAAIIVIPFLCFAIGISNLNAEVENRESMEAEIREVPLADNERTDGKIIFAIPDGFQCESEEVEPMPGSKLMLFSLNNESIGNGTICSDYDNDSSIKNFDEYWKGWEGEDDKKYPKTNVDRGSKTINGHNCMYRVIRYNVNGIHVYWRFHILFDDLSGKCCVVSCYDRNESTSYVDEILESVRFK